MDLNLHGKSVIVIETNKGVSVEQVIQEKESLIPFNRFGQPDEFAKAVVFLASGANTYITGQALIVDGGMVKAL